jgi:hypothetical protein
VFRVLLSIVDVEGDDGFGVRVEADPDAEPSQTVGKPRMRDTTWCGRTRPHEFDERRQRRLALVREIVDVPATKIHDAVFRSDPTNFVPC